MWDCSDLAMAQRQHAGCFMRLCLVVQDYLQCSGCAACGDMHSGLKLM